MRHYLTGKGEGLYLQGQMGVFYYKSIDYIGNIIIYFVCVDMPREFLWLDIMGYVGYSLKFSRVNVFIDYGYGAVMGVDTKTGHVKPVTLFDKMYWLDLNFGIGISF